MLMQSVCSSYRIKTVCKSFYKMRLIAASQNCWGEYAACELLTIFGRKGNNCSILFSNLLSLCVMTSERFGQTNQSPVSPPYSQN